MNREDAIVERLLRVYKDMVQQDESVAEDYPDDGLSFDDEFKQIAEFLGPANEYGAAYECIIANLEAAPFKLSAEAAIALLEVGLLLRYKTDREEDSVFDSRG